MKTKLMTRVKTPEEVPYSKHYSVIEFHEVTESSGWGSEHDNRVLCPHYYVSEDREAWEAHIRALEHVKVKYVASIVEARAKVERPVVIS